MPLNDTAAVALDWALDTMCEGALPWEVPADVRAHTRREFEEDFNREITSFEDWLAWRAIVLRLFRYVGSFAAYFADLKSKPSRVPGRITQGEVFLGILVAKTLCPSGDPVPQGRICNEVLKDKAAAITALRAAFAAAEAAL